MFLSVENEFWRFVFARDISLEKESMSLPSLEFICFLVLGQEHIALFWETWLIVRFFAALFLPLTFFGLRICLFYWIMTDLFVAFLCHSEISLPIFFLCLARFPDSCWRNSAAIRWFEGATLSRRHNLLLVWFPCLFSLWLSASGLRNSVPPETDILFCGRAAVCSHRVLYCAVEVFLRLALISESKDLFCSVFNKTVKSRSSIIDVATTIFFQNSDKVLRKHYLYKSIAGPKHLFCRVFHKTLAFGSFLHDVGITLSFQNAE